MDALQETKAEVAASVNSSQKKGVGFLSCIIPFLFSCVGGGSSGKKAAQPGCLPPGVRQSAAGLCP
jgi:hypothetical protein